MIRSAARPIVMIDTARDAGYNRTVTTETSVQASRRYLWLIVIAVVIATALVVVARRGSTPAAEDCETKPPPSTFAVAACDSGTAPAARP